MSLKLTLAFTAGNWEICDEQEGSPEYGRRESLDGDGSQTPTLSGLELRDLVKANQWLPTYWVQYIDVTDLEVYRADDPGCIPEIIPGLAHPQR